jgi:hypothetical protein
MFLKKKHVFYVGDLVVKKYERRLDTYANDC